MVQVDLTWVMGLSAAPSPADCTGVGCDEQPLGSCGLAAEFYVYLVSREQCLLWGVRSAGCMK